MPITRESLETYLTQNASLALGLAGGILTARLLGPAGKGLLTWLLFWPALVVVAGRLGLDAAATYYGRSDPASLPAHRQLFLPAALAAGTALSLILLAVAHLSGRGGGLGQIEHLILALVAAPAGLYTALAGGLLLGAGRVPSFNLLALLVPALTTGALLLLWASRPEWVDVPVVLVLWVAAQVVSAAAAHLLVRRAIPGRAAPDWSLIRRSLSYGLRVHLGGLAAHLNLRLMQFLIGAVSGATALGLYSTALTAAEIFAYVAVAESLVLFPTASALPVQDRWPLVKERVLRTMTLFCAGSMISILLVRPAFVTVLGPAFMGAIPVFYGLLPGIAAHSLNLLLGAGLRASGDPTAPTRAAWFGLAFGATAAPIVLPRLHVLGGAFIFSATQVVSCAYLLLAVHHHLKRAITPTDQEQPTHATMPPSPSHLSPEIHRALS